MEITNQNLICVNSTNKRQSNLEAFRIIAMFVIVLHHYIVNSGILDILLTESISFKNFLFLFLGAFGKTATNCFVLITGYFMCKSKITLLKVFKLLFEVMFYNVIIYIIFASFGVIDFSFKAIYENVFSIFNVTYGNFTTSFIVFYLFIPFLNVLINNLSKEQFLYLLGLCFLVFCVVPTIIIHTLPITTIGYFISYVGWFMVIYITSAFIRLFPLKCFNNNLLWGLLSLGLIILSGVSIYVMKILNAHPYSLLMESNMILSYINSICFFMFFKNLKIKQSNIINVIAKASFGVLLIHANSNAMRTFIWQTLFKNTNYYLNSNYYLLHCFLTVVIVYISCTIIDLIRIYLIETPIFNKIKLKNKV